VVENLLSIPLHLDASLRLAEALCGRAAVLHHHDPQWQRERFADVTSLPPDDPAWEHVVINDLTRRQFAERGLRSTTIHNGFDPDDPPGDRRTARRAIGAADGDLVLLHPVRAIARKQVPVALEVCEQLGATYWLPGETEEDYGPELAAMLETTSVPVLRNAVPGRMADAYAACDAVLFPSSWEGFGNPPVEASIHHRPVLVGNYPVGAELRGYGFRWFTLDEIDAFAAFVDQPDEHVLEQNHDIVRHHFSERVVEDRLVDLLRGRGWEGGAR
jgi:glycosyltransferase involved in cell wall biosynthesis